MEIKGADSMAGIRSAGGIISLLVLAACAQPQEILPGERLDLRAGLLSDDGTAARMNESRPISLPAPRTNDSWTHRAGTASHRIAHPALGAGTTPVWVADVGQGNARRHRITADPVVAGGRVFTLDSRATITATSAAQGATLWAADLTPPGERTDSASGGGLATADGRVFVTTGFGELVAVDAASGGILWRQRLEAGATGAPTVAGGVVYVVSKDNRAWAIDAQDGKVRWQFAGTPSPSSIVGGAGPAIGDTLAIFPFTSGEVVATFRNGGAERWRSRVMGQRPGQAYAGITSIAADPVIVGNTVYAANASGRVAALSLDSGNPVWTAREGATSPLWVEGGSVFFVSDQGELLRLDASSGARIWGVPLPYQVTDNPRRQRDVHVHYGPVLAGGRLWVASSDGLMRAFSPENGAQITAAEIPAGAAANPVVAGGTLFVVSAAGRLHAYR